LPVETLTKLLTTLPKIALKQAIAFFVLSTLGVNNSLLSPTAAKDMEQFAPTFEDYHWQVMSFSTGFRTMGLKFCGLSAVVVTFQLFLRSPIERLVAAQLRRYIAVAIICHCIN